MKDSLNYCKHQDDLMDLAKFLFPQKKAVARQDFSTVFNLEDVSVSFGKIAALRSVNLEINQGEKVFLTGPSGAGKTTLLKVLAGKLEPDSGRVLGALSQKNDSSKFISLVFQDLRLIHDLTVEDNLWVAYDPKIYQSKNLFYEDMEKLCGMLNINDRLNDKVNNLNGGLKQKIAIIRSLLTRPKVLLADEPTSALDRDNTFKLYDLLNFYCDQKGMTLVWASHNKELVKQFSGRIIHIENGRIIYVGHACFI